MDTRRVTRSKKQEREVGDIYAHGIKKRKVVEQDKVSATFADNAVFQSGAYTMVYKQSRESHDRRSHVLLSSDKTDVEIDYVIGNELGAGSFGVVYKFSSVNESIAVKTPGQKWVAANYDCESDITDEFYFLRKAYPGEGPYMLQHMYRDGERNEEYSYRMMMPLVNGKRIREMITEVKEPILITRLLLRVMEELQRIHEQGVIHGDIRCGNILVERSGRNDFNAHFIDFGLAYSSLGCATVFSAQDKECFIPPERVTLKPLKAHPRQDVFSLARTFEYEINNSGLTDAGFKKLCQQFPAVETFMSNGLNLIASERPMLTDVIAELTVQYNDQAMTQSHGKRKFSLFTPKTDLHVDAQNLDILKRNAYTATYDY